VHFSNLRVEADAPGLPVPGEGGGPAGPSRLLFDVDGVDLCVVNALRRAIMADVRTAAIAFDPRGGPESAERNDVEFRKNTTVLHNEFLGHRISLVPLNFDERQLAGFHPSQYKFVLQAKNAGETVLDLTTAHFRVLDAATDAALPNAFRDALFPPSPVTGDHVLLVRLKPGARGDGNGEEVDLTCRARLGSGRDHARWSPVSECHFRNRLDPVAYEAALAATLARKGVDPADPASASAGIRRQHEAFEGQRCFLKNAHGEPCAFEFVLKSETRLRPAHVVRAGFEALAAMVRALLRGVQRERVGRAVYDARAAVAGDGGDGAAARVTEVDVLPAPNMDDVYDLVVSPADHTLGNLVQGMLYVRWVRAEQGDEDSSEGAEDRVRFIGYHQPHPLEDRILFKIKCAVGDDVLALFERGVAWVAGRLDALGDEWAAVAKLSNASNASDGSDGAGSTQRQRRVRKGDDE
jgi:DNA-directed RNA polymerase subunit L